MGMARLNVRMQTTVDREELLAKLKENRKNHSTIVREAQAGYLKSATKKAEKALAILKTGKAISLQVYAIMMPVDYTSAYDTVISMLEWSKDKTITLAADEFRQFVEDQWDWKDGFIASNSHYSSTARSLSLSNDAGSDGY